MPDLMRAQVTFAHKDGLPRDNVSSNFWFATADGTDVDDATAVAERVRDFYIEPVSPRSLALSAHLAKSIADSGHTVKVYDYDMATGERTTFADAPPIVTLGFAIPGARDTGNPLPSEVAMCLSYRNNSGATPGGGNFTTPPAQRRGRIYFGPIGEVRNIEGSSSEARPDTALADYLNSAAFVLIGSNPETAPQPWVIYSRPFAGRGVVERDGRPPLRAIPARSGQAYIIEQTWVDNAWDTQRRRGERATVRTYG